MNNLLAATLDENLQGIVTKLQSLMDSFWIYIVMALAAVVVIWGAYVGIKIAIAKMKMHQKIVLTVLSPAKNSIILTFSPLYVTSVIPDIAENISISPSTSFRSHRKRSKHNC